MPASGVAPHRSDVMRPAVVLRLPRRRESYSTHHTSHLPSMSLWPVTMTMSMSSWTYSGLLLHVRSCSIWHATPDVDQRVRWEPGKRLEASFEVPSASHLSRQGLAGPRKGLPMSPLLCTNPVCSCSAGEWWGGLRRVQNTDGASVQ